MNVYHNGDKLIDFKRKHYFLAIKDESYYETLRRICRFGIDFYYFKLSQLGVKLATLWQSQREPRDRRARWRHISSEHS